MRLPLALVGALLGGAVAFADASAEGSLDREDIRRVVQRGMRDVRACYEKRLLQKPTLSGKLVARWTVGSNGRVTNTTVAESSTNDSELDNCVLGVVASWTFPRARGGAPVVINYPFAFTTVK